MNVKLSVLSLLLMGWTTSLFADDNEKGIDFYKAGMYKYAKEALLQNIQSGKGNKAEACYYLGEIYSAENKADSAAFYYKEGLVADPEYVFNGIGELKLGLANNPDAEKAFAGYTSGKNKKNPAVFVAIARAYMPTSLAKTKEYFEKAKLVGAKSPDVYILEGDILAAEKQIGEAANRYEQAIYFDANNKEAYLKYARIYKKANPQLAIDMMNKLIEIDPGYTTAYRDLADIYYENGQFQNAAEAYSKYITAETSDMDDLARYATILYLSQDHAKAQELVSQVMARAPQNSVMQRLNMYISFDKGDFAKALELADKMVMSPDTTNLISRDYIYYAQTLAKNNRGKDAVAAYRKAIDKDTSRIELYKDMADLAEKEGLYDDAIAAMGVFIAKGGDSVKVADYFNLGRTNYRAASELMPEAGTKMLPADSMEMVGYAQAADSLFAYVAKKVPDSYLGNFWRARINAVLDPETTQGLSKPYYEAAVALMEGDKEKNRNNLIEAYRYLGYYYFVREDVDNSIKYWEQILQLDPEHAMAKTALEALKQQKK